MIDWIGRFLKCTGRLFVVAIGIFVAAALGVFLGGVIGYSLVTLCMFLFGPLIGAFVGGVLTLACMTAIFIGALEA